MTLILGYYLSGIDHMSPFKSSEFFTFHREEMKLEGIEAKQGSDLQFLDVKMEQPLANECGQHLFARVVPG